MKRVAYLCSSVVLVLGLQPSCLLPAIDDSTRQDDAKDTGPSIPAPSEDGGADASVTDTSGGAEAGTADTSVSSGADTTDASVSSDADANVGPTESLDSTVSDAAEAGPPPCGANDQACCASEPVCDGTLSCEVGTCGGPLLLRAVYSHHAPNTNVDALDYVAFSATRRREVEPLFTRPSISSLVTSRDGNRLAFLASDSNTPGAPNVVWLLDGLDQGNAPSAVASSNPALSRTALMADGNLDYILTCSGLEYCEQLELYRRNEQTFTTIANNVWSAVIGYDNGLLVYQTEDSPLRVYWLDLTEVNAVPQLLMTAEDNDHIPFIGPAMLSQTGRTLSYIYAFAPTGTTAEDLAWTVFGTELGLSEPTPLQSGVGLIAAYTQRDGSSALVVHTDINGRYTKIVRHGLGVSGFEAAQELFNKELDEEIDLGASTDIALAPLVNTFDTHFHFFGAPQAIQGNKVFVTPYVLPLDGSPPLAMTTEPCLVYPAGQDMLSPRISLTQESTAASLGWLRCNRNVGYINLDQAKSFAAVDETCPECSPGQHFVPIDEGVVYAHIDVNAASTPHYYATRGNVLELIPSGTEGGEVKSLVVSRSDAQLPLWRDMWHLGGAIGLELPRTWRKLSQAVDEEPTILAGPSVFLGNDPLTAGGVHVSLSTDVTRSPEQTVTGLPERNACPTKLGSDAGSFDRNGVTYEFYSERRMNCGAGAHRWFLALKASDHSVLLLFHDPQGTGEDDFNRMWSTIRVEPSRLNRESSALDAGIGD